MEHPPFMDGSLGTLWSSVFWILHAIANIACSYFIYQSAARRTHAALNIGPYWWVLFTMVGGIWTLFIYWVIEHSSLSAHQNPDV